MPPPLLFGPFGATGPGQSNTTLQYGSTGQAVADLQKSLNVLPSLLRPLGVDGNYGNLTTGRVREFQVGSTLDPDGRAGPLTLGGLGNALSDWANDPLLPKRLAVVSIARFESLTGFDVAMKLPEQADGKGVGVIDPADRNATRRPFRKGHNVVIRYFQSCLPPVQFRTVQDNVHHLTKAGDIAPMPHWCGIFALWAIRTANVPVGQWDLNHGGISNVRGFKLTNTPRLGDVGFLNNGFEHHVILASDPFADGVTRKVLTIEGNSRLHSEFNSNTRTMDEISRVYTCY